MLKAPTKEPKERESTHTASARETQRQQHPPFSTTDEWRSAKAREFGPYSRAVEFGQRVAGLQTTVGNQTVLTFLSRFGEANTQSRPARHRCPTSVPALSASPHRIQTKLTVNRPGDEYEQEGDRVAEYVMRMPDGVLPTATDF